MLLMILIYLYLLWKIQKDSRITTKLGLMGTIKYLHLAPLFQGHLNICHFLERKIPEH